MRRLKHVAAFYAVVALGFSFVWYLEATAAANINPNDTKRVIINFRPKVAAQQKIKALTSIGAKLVSNITGKGNDFVVVVVDVPKSVIDKGNGWYYFLPQPPAKTIMSILPDDVKPDIVSIEEDYRVRWIEEPASFQATPFPTVESVVAQLPKLTIAAIRPEITWGIDRVHAPAAWQFTEGKGVRVGIIDTGIDANHPELIGQVDGGYDAISKTTLKENWQDQNGHGTHVAGTVAALRNGKGVVGVAPKARLYAVRVLDADGSGQLSDVIDGIIWCANNGIQVANMSLGSGQDSETMHNAVRYAAATGLIIAAAAGNSGGAVGYPGSYLEVISVSASNINDEIAPFSSRGPEVDFIAPGVDVVSSKMGGGYVSYSGTSMATPHVTGIVALAVSQGWVGLNGPDGVMAQLRKAATKLAGLKDIDQGAGMIDAGKLVR
jgi:subtilisin